jgi:hypothetical protein
MLATFRKCASHLCKKKQETWHLMFTEQKSFEPKFAIYEFGEFKGFLFSRDRN